MRRSPAPNVSKNRKGRFRDAEAKGFMMKKRSFPRFFVLLVSLLAAVLLTGCDEAAIDDFFFGTPTCRHKNAEVVTTENVTCTEDGYTTRHCPDCGLTDTVVNKATGHKLVHHAEKPATCTEGGFSAYDTCAKCGYSTYRELPAKGHKLLHHAGKAPTASASGYADYDTCENCDYSTYRKLFATAGIDDYGDDFWYTRLGARERGEALCNFYGLLDAAAKNFFLDTDADAELLSESTPRYFRVATVNFSACGLSLEEAQLCWEYLRRDRPVYYWLASSVAYTSKELTLLTYPEYAEGKSRAGLNAKVLAFIDGFSEAVGGKTDPYEIAEILHDALLSRMTYAYQEDGVTPSDAPWAHSILGAAENGAGVCESYARTFQLLLNAYGVENIFISGTADGTPHAWNLISLGESGWYWCDVTWDDNIAENSSLATVSVYFCRTDTEQITGIGKEDGYSFLTGHTPDTADLPARAETPYGKAH